MGAKSKGSSTSEGDTREYGEYDGCRGCKGGDGQSQGSDPIQGNAAIL